MANSKLPTSTGPDVAAFLQKVASARPPVKTSGRRGRLLFAMDATASREPAWDMAAQIQNEMFRETAAVGGLDVQLVYYRGFLELYKSAWQSSEAGLHKLIGKVRCAAGATQILRVLKHAVKENTKNRIQAIVFVGDAVEENVDELAHQAGLLGMQGVPAFMFHEGRDATAATAFKEVARLSGGAYCSFDAGSAHQLKELLGAVAVYAAGGRQALLDFAKTRSTSVLQLTHQMNRSSN